MLLLLLQEQAPSLPLTEEGTLPSLPLPLGPLTPQGPEPAGRPSPGLKPLGLGLHRDEALRLLVGRLEPIVYNGVFSSHGSSSCITDMQVLFILLIH